MVGEIHIWYPKRKYKPNAEEVSEMTKYNDVHLHGVPIRIFEKLIMLLLKNYSLEIYENENSEKSINIETYLLNEDILTKGLPSIHYIFVSTKQVRKPFAYVVLRKGE